MRKKDKKTRSEKENVMMMKREHDPKTRSRVTLLLLNI